MPSDSIITNCKTKAQNGASYCAHSSGVIRYNCWKSCCDDVPASVSGTLPKKLKPLKTLLLFSFRWPMLMPSAASRAALNLHDCVV